VVYKPRSKEEIDRIAALVRSAIGYDQKRGDQVEVANLRLAESPSILAAEPTGWMSMLQFSKDDIMHWVEVGVMALLAILVLLLGFRPIIRRILDIKGEAEAAAAGGVRTIVGPGGVTMTVGPNGVVPAPGMNITGGAAGSITSAGGPNVAIVGTRRGGRHLQSHVGDDRHRSGAGPGACPVGAEGRRTRRQEPPTKPSPSSADGCTKTPPERETDELNRHGHSAEKSIDRNREPRRNAGRPPDRGGQADQAAHRANNRLVARGEVVLVEDKLGVTITEVIKAERN
jgi:hypothetical protein